MAKYEYIRRIDLSDEQMNSLGQEGWECYATTESFPRNNQFGFRMFFFKRMI